MKKKIALVHDYLFQFGGAERVFYALHKIFPEASIYTTIFLPKRLPDFFRKLSINTSFMQKIPFIAEFYRYFFHLYPFAVRSFDLSSYDLVISSSSAWAKGIRKRKDARHVCYCHTPARFIWRYREYVQKENFPFIIQKVLPLLLLPIKQWDISNTRGVDYFISNSDYISNRIKNVYHRDSKVIHPPIDTDFFSLSNTKGDYFLIVSRFLAYKRIDLVINAFKKLKQPLKIVGAGPHENALKKLAEGSGNIAFLGKVPERELLNLYQNCLSVIFPGEEDFGLVPLEAASCGKPTIAFYAGGAKETIIEEKTGIFFREQTENSINEAMTRFLGQKFDRMFIREHALKFNFLEFKKKILGFLDEKQIL